MVLANQVAQRGVKALTSGEKRTLASLLRRARCAEALGTKPTNRTAKAALGRDVRRTRSAKPLTTAKPRAVVSAASAVLDPLKISDPRLKGALQGWLEGKRNVADLQAAVATTGNFTDVCNAMRVAQGHMAVGHDAGLITAMLERGLQTCRYYNHATNLQQWASLFDQRLQQEGATKASQAVGGHGVYQRYVKAAAELNQNLFEQWLARPLQSYQTSAVMMDVMAKDIRSIATLQDAVVVAMIIGRNMRYQRQLLGDYNYREIEQPLKVLFGQARDKIEALSPNGVSHEVNTRLAPFLAPPPPPPPTPTHVYVGEPVSSVPQPWEPITLREVWGAIWH